jgi:lambda family phage portal protein
MSKRKRKPQPPAPAASRRRAYEGAMVSRLTADWVTSSTSADAEIDGSLVRLRNRSRQLVRDNGYAQQALRCIVSNVIGTGVRMQAQVPMQGGDGRPDTTINDLIERQWAHWSHADTCHAAGQLSLQEIARLAWRAMAESGEVFIRLVPEAMGAGVVPLALEILEADLVDEGKTSGPEADGGEWRMGVRVNRWGRPTAYRFRTRHPGDVSGSIGYSVVDVPADEVLHLRRIERPGQTRGVPWFAAAIKGLHHLAGYQEAEVVRARAASSLMGFITSPEGELVGDDVYDAERVSNFEPGVFKYLAPGESVSVPQLDAPDGQFEPFLRAMLRGVAASTGCSFEQVSNDYSQSNYSSNRMSRQDSIEMWKGEQQYAIEHFYRPIFQRWMDAAVGVGDLPLPNYDTMRDRYQSVRWYPRAWGFLDPKVEIGAYKDAVRCGFMTQSQVVAEQGGDLAELMRDLAAERAMAQDLGLTLDIDAGKVSGAGLTQARPVGSIIPQDPYAPEDTAAESEGMNNDGPDEPDDDDVEDLS